MVLFTKLFNWFFPYGCTLCHGLSTIERNICLSCQSKLPILPQGCQHCATIIFSNSSRSCGQCLQKKPPFDFTHVLFTYQPPITQLILNLKFNHALANAQLFGDLLIEAMDKWYQYKPLPTAIMPVPLHPQRLKERGFNQALEIARPIAKKLQLPLLIQHSQRVKATLAQATLAGKMRHKNIQDAFKLIREIEHEHIAIVDDVITTGSTITELCKQLKNHGIKKIDVWSCAKVI